MKITAIKNYNNNLRKKFFIASVGLMSLVTPLSANKKQNITNPVPLIYNVKEKNITANKNYKDFFALEETKDNFSKKEKKSKDLSDFEKFIAMFSGFALANLLTILKSKLLKIVNEKK